MKHVPSEPIGLRNHVAPRAGAWVETDEFWAQHPKKRSHPVRVRGLKHGEGGPYSRYARSHPVRVRGLKPGMVLELFEQAEGRTPCGCVG